ncbi:MAG: matrixin family metalloprotease [Betaproteobacteria bacterium]
MRLIAAALLAACMACAQCQAQVLAHWARPASVAVIGPEGDARIALVHEAVAFWNRTFAELGVPFQVGPVEVRVGAIAVDELTRLRDQFVERRFPIAMPAAVENIPADIVIALSDGDFVSFALRWPLRGKALAAIKTHRLWPLSLPNVARNVVAHELGHVLGLGHNDDPEKLMCGRPAPCRPDATQSNTPRIFPLTEWELARLREMYTRVTAAP